MLTRGPELDVYGISGNRLLERRFSPPRRHHQADDCIRALDILGKYGLGTQQQHGGPDGGVIPLGVVELPMMMREDGDGS